MDVGSKSGEKTEGMCRCGKHELEKTAGICPVLGCAKNLLNGPCGGVNDGMCEVPGRGKCIWVIIFEKMESSKMLDKFIETRMPKIK